jgi:hypothetical protein
MLEKLKHYKEWYALIVGILAIIWSIFSQYQTLKDRDEELVQTLKTTQQMALKSVIWNDAIPLGERAAACDVYLNNGYNSLTKKECEVIIEEGAEDGIF